MFRFVFSVYDAILESPILTSEQWVGEMDLGETVGLAVTLGK